MPNQEWKRENAVITTDRSRVDLAAVHGFLTTSYWCAGIPVETVQRAIDHSIPFMLLVAGRAAGFARVVTDRATVAYIGDVFVLPEFRDRKLSVWMMECIVAHPELQGLRRWILLTRDAHGLYTKFGFTPLAVAERWMERHDRDVYSRGV